MPTTFKKAIPLFFHLVSNAFPDIGLVGRIEKKTLKKINKKSRRTWYPRVMLKVNIHIFGLTKCTIKTVKNAPVFVPVFLYAVTMLIFQTKRIISNEKWFNYIDSDDAKRRKKRVMIKNISE